MRVCALCGRSLHAQRSTRRFCGAACKQRAYRNGIKQKPVTITRAEGADWELRLGAYDEAMVDVACDALVADPPYSARTHAGHDGAVSSVGGSRRRLSYQGWDRRDVRAFVRFWHPRTRGWLAVLSCSVLAPIWREELERAGRYAFAAVPCVIPGMSVRLSGDGPSSWAVMLTVARPKSKEWATWGTLPGAYQARRGADHIGGKPLELMSAIVRDYSRPGDVIADPVAGLATTGVAALSEGRQFIGGELDGATYQRAVDRLRGGIQPALLGGAA